MHTARLKGPKDPACSFRLDLTIGRTIYAIQPLPESPLPGSPAFRLVKGDGTIYDVASTTYGPVCDCPDYLFRREGLDPSGCKHIKALIGSGLIRNDSIRLDSSKPKLAHMMRT